MKTTFLAAAAATAMLVAAPVLAAPPDTANDTQQQQQSNTTSKQSAGKTTHAKRTKQIHRRHSSQLSPRRQAYRQQAYRDQPAWQQQRPMNTGFAPFDFAGDVVGGAIGTAGAIAGTAVGTAGAVAAAPFGAGPYGYRESYAYNMRGDDDFMPGYTEPAYNYNGTALQYSQSYAARNGFVCQPGTIFRDANGQRRICQ